jgi:hypothetical protein
MVISTVFDIPCVLSSPTFRVPFSATKIKFNEHAISQIQEISCTSTVDEQDVVPKSEFPGLNPRPHGHKATALLQRQSSPSGSRVRNKQKKGT